MWRKCNWRQLAVCEHTDDMPEELVRLVNESSVVSLPLWELLSLFESVNPTS